VATDAACLEPNAKRQAVGNVVAAVHAELNIVARMPLQNIVASLNACRNAALQELLLCEDEVAAMLSLERTIPHAPAPAVTPATYPRLMTAESRPRQTKLRWWDRFQTADGWIAATARTIVALTVVGSVIALGIVLTIPEATRALDPPLEPQPLRVDEPSLSQPIGPPALETLPARALEAAPMEEPAAPTESSPAPEAP
jgi:hypothetical protein